VTFSACAPFGPWTIRPPRSRKYRVTFIDHGYCFNAGEWTFPDAAARGVYARNEVYRTVTGWKSFEPALSRAQGMGVDDIRQLPPVCPRSGTGRMPMAWTESLKPSTAVAASSLTSSPLFGSPAAPLSRTGGKPNHCDQCPRCSVVVPRIPSEMTRL